MLVCSECGRKMQGNVIGRKVSPRVGYRCVHRDEYPGDQAHPRSLFVAEDRIIPVLDGWLTELSSKNVDEIIALLLNQAGREDAEPAEVRRARKVSQEAQTTLDRYLTRSKRAWTRAFTSSARERPSPSWQRPQR